MSQREQLNQDGFSTIDLEENLFSDPQESLRQQLAERSSVMSFRDAAGKPVALPLGIAAVPAPEAEAGTQQTPSMRTTLIRAALITVSLAFWQNLDFAAGAELALADQTRNASLDTWLNDNPHNLSLDEIAGPIISNEFTAPTAINLFFNMLLSLSLDAIHYAMGYAGRKYPVYMSKAANAIQAITLIYFALTGMTIMAVLSAKEVSDENLCIPPLQSTKEEEAFGDTFKFAFSTMTYLLAGESSQLIDEPNMQMPGLILAMIGCAIMMVVPMFIAKASTIIGTLDWMSALKLDKADKKKVAATHIARQIRDKTPTFLRTHQILGAKISRKIDDDQGAYQLLAHKAQTRPGAALTFFANAFHTLIVTGEAIAVICSFLVTAGVLEGWLSSQFSMDESMDIAVNSSASDSALTDTLPAILTLLVSIPSLVTINYFADGASEGHTIGLSALMRVMYKLTVSPLLVAPIKFLHLWRTQGLDSSKGATKGFIRRELRDAGITLVQCGIFIASLAVIWIAKKYTGKTAGVVAYRQMMKWGATLETAEFSKELAEWITGIFNAIGFLKNGERFIKWAINFSKDLCCAKNPAARTPMSPTTELAADTISVADRLVSLMDSSELDERMRQVAIRTLTYTAEVVILAALAAAGVTATGVPINITGVDVETDIECYFWNGTDHGSRVITVTETLNRSVTCLGFTNGTCPDIALDWNSVSLPSSDIPQWTLHLIAGVIINSNGFQRDRMAFAVVNTLIALAFIIPLTFVVNKLAELVSSGEFTIMPQENGLMGVVINTIFVVITHAVTSEVRTRMFAPCLAPEKLVETQTVGGALNSGTNSRVKTTLTGISTFAKPKGTDTEEDAANNYEL